MIIKNKKNRVAWLTIDEGLCEKAYLVRILDKIVEFIKNKEEVSRKELNEEFKDISIDTITRYLRELFETGRIKKSKRGEYSVEMEVVRC